MVKCDPRAYAKCPTKQYCAPSADGCEFVNGSECDQFNRKVLSQPMTNADRIRAMSDEGLAHWLIEISLGNKRQWCNFHCEKDGQYGCEKCVLKWLQQPAEEG